MYIMQEFNEKLQLVQEYFNNRDRLVKRIIYYPDGENPNCKNIMFIHEYNKKGYIIKVSKYTKKGKLKYIHEYNTKGNLFMEYIYRNNKLIYSRFWDKGMLIDEQKHD